MGAKIADKETPLMKQYYGIKAKYPGALLLFRVGDFYETFGEDAQTASKVLGIVLTKRSNGAASDMDLAGFPHHSLDAYLPKLVRAGFRVAICDQLEDPKQAKTIVKRGVTELVTPGISYNDKVLESRKSNFLASVFVDQQKAGLAFLDISTGEFLTAQGDLEYAKKLLDGFKPSEVICKKSDLDFVKMQSGELPALQTLDEWVYTFDFANEKLTRHFQTSGLKGFGISEWPLSVIAAGAILHYLEQTHHTQIGHILSISRIDEDKFLWLDGFTIRNLELVQPMFSGGKSLLDVIDFTSTPMGSRLLRNWMVLPLKDLGAIIERHSVVDYFHQQADIRANAIAILTKIGDLQRLISKVALNRINPRESLQLKRSLMAVSELKGLLNQQIPQSLKDLLMQMHECQQVIDRIDKDIADDAPALINKGQIFTLGVHAELDELRTITTHGKEHLLFIQKREIEKTGIPSLKVAYNNVFGYYLEVTHAHKDKVPSDWIRKQTLTNAERYITPELKDYEDKILNAEERIASLEIKLWEEFTRWLSEFVPLIQITAHAIAKLDCLCGFGELAYIRNYVKPSMNDGFELDLKEARHPMIEPQLPPGENYIPNDTLLNDADQRLIILTGPNMSGKSAVLRQTALCVLLAQMGSFVPCSAATIGLTDKIYTRVGASDNISLGESTFMVEMLETASILNNISNRSLIILDEIGRGTSTYDGVSLAWSIAEFLQQHPYKPKTLFATHYHELNELEGKFEGIKNFHISIKEQGQRIIFLRKLTPGGSEHSFGIHVARMAGIPKPVTERAEEILSLLEGERTQLNKGISQKMKKEKSFQLNMFSMDDPIMAEIKEELATIDINAMSPVEALIKLNQLKNKIQS